MIMETPNITKDHVEEIFSILQSRIEALRNEYKDKIKHSFSREDYYYHGECVGSLTACKQISSMLETKRVHSLRQAKQIVFELVTIHLSLCILQKNMDAGTKDSFFRQGEIYIYSQCIEELEEELGYEFPFEIKF